MCYHLFYMRRGFNFIRNSEPEQKLYRADIPVMGEVVLEKVKTERLVPTLMACHEHVQSIEVNTIYDMLRHWAAQRKLARAQQEYRAASFVVNGDSNYGRIITSEEVEFVSIANQLIYDALLPLDSPEMSGKELAQRSVITLYPANVPPPSIEFTLSA
jgi:hypothetical protein